MYVSSGATWNTATEMRRVDIGLDASDGEQILGTEKWSTLSVSNKLKALQLLADNFVVVYMHEQGGIDKENAKHRFGLIRNALKDLS